MLKSNKGSITVCGEVEEVKSEFATLVHALRYTMNISSEEILEIVNLGLLSEKELDDKISELDNIISKVDE